MTPQRQRLNEARDAVGAARRRPYPELVVAWEAFFAEREAWYAHLSHIRHHASRRYRARRRP